MRNFQLFFLAVILSSGACMAQNLKIKVYDPPLPYTGNLGDWAADYVVSSTEPFGRASGVVRPVDTLYVAVPDTNILPGSSGVILRSTNNGANWSIIITVQPAVIVGKTRMFRSGVDSIYCVIRIAEGAFANQIYILKVNSPPALRQFYNGGYRDFDAWASSTGGLYLFVDSLGTNNLVRYGSADGGVTWVQRGVVSSAAAHPFVYKSGSGDTCLLMYYQITAALTDTTTAGITHTRYAQSGLGLLTSIGPFLTSVIPAGPQKAQFGAAWFGGTSWAVYTTGAPGSRDIMFLLSTNSGTTYGAPIPLANNPNVDEYYFDITHYTASPGGADAVYYWDSTGGPSNSTDKLMYTFVGLPTPGTFASPTQISEHPPQSSTRGYIPFLMEYYNTAGDVGAVWVGLDASVRRLYFDRLGALTSIHQQNNELPFSYSLGQNYPNPFNPATKIDFAVPIGGPAFMKVYDVLGREVALLIDKELKAGYYTVDFDASRLPSGVYFYRLISGSFSETKKMILVK